MNVNDLHRKRQATRQEKNTPIKFCEPFQAGYKAASMNRILCTLFTTSCAAMQAAVTR